MNESTLSAHHQVYVGVTITIIMRGAATAPRMHRTCCTSASIRMDTGRYTGTYIAIYPWGNKALGITIQWFLGPIEDFSTLCMLNYI